MSLSHLENPVPLPKELASLVDDGAQHHECVWCVEPITKGLVHYKGEPMHKACKEMAEHAWEHLEQDEWQPQNPAS